MQNKNLLILAIFVFFAFSLTLVYSQYPRRKSMPHMPQNQHKDCGRNGSRCAPDEDLMPENVTIKGNLVCLPHQGNGEVQTTECALGIKDVSDRYFSLDIGNTITNTTGFDPFSISMEETVIVSGTFSKNTPDNIYDTVGVIKTDNIVIATEE